MKIGILGAGNVGSALGRSFARNGHEVMYGVRDASKPEVVALVEETGARAGSLAEAAQFGEVVVLSVHWGSVRGPLSQSRYLEPYAMIWIRLAFRLMRR